MTTTINFNEQEKEPPDFQFKKKKKRRKPTVTKGTLDCVTGLESGTDKASQARTEYLGLLESFYDWYSKKFPESEKKKHSCYLPEPEIIIASKSIILKNFKLICQRLNRPSEHVMQFILNELGTRGNINGQMGLIIKGKFTSQNIKNILTSYVKTYIRCKTCQKTNTEITRDRKHDINFLRCLDCGATSSVTKIQVGYRAISREDRKKNKTHIY